MSREARDWVWQHAPVEDPRQLLILLSIADVANQYGSGAYPSVSRMARDSRSNPRTVTRHLAALVDRGVLEVEVKAGQHRPTTYGLPLMPRGDTVTDQPRQIVTSESARGDTGVTNGQSAPLYGTGNNTHGARAFETFWQAYPDRRGRKLGKDKAEQQWERMTDRTRGEAMKAVHTYSAACAKGDTLAKDAHRWLRDKQWVEWAGEVATVTRLTVPPEESLILRALTRGR